MTLRFRLTPSKALRRVAALTVFGAASLALGACDSPLVGLEDNPDVEQFVQLMNAHRQSVGCEPLGWNPVAADVAREHSQDMIDRSYFAHDNPDGHSPFDRMASAGLTYSRAAENIAYGYPTAEAVLDGWLNSPGHRRNIENCNLTEHGVGLVGTHWTHVFLTP
ncbi:MAG: CAP domain-containing protein [Gemmatimonadota bacterium]